MLKNCHTIICNITKIRAARKRTLVFKSPQRAVVGNVVCVAVSKILCK